MNSLNQIILEGNVIRQPEMKSFAGGVRVCNVPIAVNRSYKDTQGRKVDEASYFDIATFGNLAESCTKWCVKGRGIRVVGRLKQNRYENKEGKKTSRIEIIAEHIDFKPFIKKNDGQQGQVFAPQIPPAAPAENEDCEMTF